jgi:hypothetical protein
MARNEDDIAAEVIKKHQRSEGDRGTWESHWEEIAKRVLPSYAGSFTGRDQREQGAKRTEEMFDATASSALMKFAAFMESMLTPRNSRWHRVAAMDKTLSRNRLVREFLDDTADVLFKYRYAAKANYASQQHEVWTGLGAFGTGSMLVDPLDKRWGGGLRYKAVHLGEIYFSENYQGGIDTSSRKFDLTARQAVQQFNKPGDTLPREIAEAAADPGKADTKFWFIHCVKPRSDMDGYDPNRLDYRGMQYGSYYVSLTGRKLIREGGHNTFPYPISRYTVAPGETYGRSPAMLCLPAIKVLNEQKKTLLKQGHRAVDPVLLAYDDGVIDAFSMKPGAINNGGVSAEGRPLVHALPVGNLALQREMMEYEAHAINDAFLVTLFQILVDTPQMTATEVLERAREKGALLSPTMGRQQSEFLGPLIDRELDVLALQGLLPPMPQILKDAGGEIDIVYDSPLSRAQRAEEAAGVTRLFSFLQPYVNDTGDVSVFDHFNMDEMIPDLADTQAIPARWLADANMVKTKRDGRAQAQQTQQMIDAAPAAAGLMKNMPGAGA